ncbi:hypothetical protein [Coralloluteibacterium stylophorae]|uniref:Uncharacterized protein n=1 Tax=Coralloluteibacterium stylophorae TaxID=1776034 RepID=A0A8J7VT41_9GAMM|nr:hypothetical protein [Coralloluteibacterium stylophorae]MBS7457087.1 hypothetical protein [Coralloluteibacterium stylophorae]
MTLAAAAQLQVACVRASAADGRPPALRQLLHAVLVFGLLQVAEPLAAASYVLQSAWLWTCRPA